MTTTIAWLHADNLNPHQEALTQAGDIPAIFVWDDELLAEWDISFKRIVFIYECLLEIPNLTIRKGNVADEVAAFAAEQGAQQILTPFSPSPKHRVLCQQIVNQLESGSKLTIVHDAPFVDYDNEQLDLKRQSRYWRTVKKTALKPTPK